MSFEDKKLIAFPGSKEGLNQSLQHNKVSDKEGEFEDNLIPFPGANHTELLSVKEGQSWDRAVRAQKETSLHVIDRKNKEFWKQSSFKSDSSSVESLTEDQKPSAGEGNGGGGKKSKKPYYAFSSVACALFLMLGGVPFFYNQKSQIYSQRGLVSVSPVKVLKGDGQKYEVHIYENTDRDLSVKLMERQSRFVATEEHESRPKQSKFVATKEMEKLKKKLNRQEKAILNLITTGQRKIASVGRKPSIKEVFSMETLKARYNVRWSRGKLSSASLLEGQEPVVLPSMEKVVREYRALFPNYTTIRKKDDLSDDLEVYELRNNKNSAVKQVEASKDEQGRLLSIHVMSY